MKNKKGTDGGAGGHVEVGMKVVSPPMATLEQLKNDVLQEFNKKYSAFEICDVVSAGDRERLQDLLDSAIEKAWEAGREQYKKDILADFGERKDLKHRCIMCGKESEITWEQAIKLNALAGACLSCVSSVPSTGS